MMPNEKVSQKVERGDFFAREGDHGVVCDG